MPQRPDLPVDGTTITSAWGSTVRDQIVTPFSTSGVRSGEIGSPVTGQASTLTAANTTNGLYVWNGLSWRPPWNMPYGIAAISALPGALNFTNSVAYSSTFTWTAVDNRYYRVTLTGNLANSTVIGADMSLGIYDNAGTPALQVIYPKTTRAGANENGHAGGSALFLSTASGVQTWKIGAGHNSGTATTCTFTASALIIEDLGPNGAPVA
jgi:hypothetical protein